jgi:hypothetical protein
MFQGVKFGRCVGLTTLPQSVSRLSRQREILNISKPYRPPRPVMGLAFNFFYFYTICSEVYIMHYDLPHCSLTVTENKWLMELITASHCRWIINSHTRTSLIAVEHNAVKRSTRLIASLLSERYRPSDINIHRENSYAPSSQRRTGRRKAHSREPVNKIKILPVYVHTCT